MNISISLLSINKFQFLSCDFFFISQLTQLGTMLGVKYMWKKEALNPALRVDKHKQECKHTSENRDTKEKYRME